MTRSFSPNTTAWILGLPTNETIYQGIGTSTKVAATDYSYDGTTSCQQASTSQTPTQGDLTRIVRWLAGGTSPETRMAYDVYGKLICTRDANGNTTTVKYDSSAMFPTVTTNPLGHRTTIQYYGVDGVPADSGLYGQTKSVTDANNATTTTQYDVFGRATQVTAPDGSLTQSSYNAFGAGVGVQHVRTDTSAGLSTWTYFDGLGRTILEKTTGPNGKVLVSQTQYDSRGLVAQSSLPYFEGGSPSWRTMTYDPPGRVLSAANPDGSRTLQCYRDWVTVSVDANNHRRRETRDAAGRVAKVEEYVGNFTTCAIDAGTPYATTRYDYDVLGNLLTVTDAKKNVTEMQYDTMNRKRFMHDPDMGDWSYDYDLAGNLVRQMDAKGQVLTFTYDALNRRTSKTLPGGKQIVYRYDNQKYGIGRLSKVEDLSGSTVFTYDSLGRVIKTQKTVLPVMLPGNSVSYVTQTTYDPLGRVTSIRYPDTTVVNYAYNGPVLDRVYDQGTVYAAYSGYNALGQPAHLTFGNGVVTDYTYSNATNHDCPEQNFRPCTTTTQGATGTYQNFRYRYDRGGNILSINDIVNGDQAFQYDDLTRLLSATGTYGPINYAYDEIGNLTCNSQIGACSAGNPNYLYPPSGSLTAKPHAVTSVGTANFIYDKNGNMLSGAGRTITYDPENRPVSIATAAGTTSFVYDGDGGRVMKIIGATATTYIGKLYECTGGQCLKYIFAGEQRIAVRVVGSNLDYYYHPDHLGSSNAITDMTGKRVQNLAYFPFGQTRVQEGTVDAHHKYTGQEFDDSTGLYFYGARYYDPALDRFISADTVVSGATDPQSLNAYTYVRNNPLLYTDPTGHRWKLFSKRGIAQFTSRTLRDVSRMKNFGGLLAMGLLTNPTFGLAYGWSTGDWKSVGRANATSAAIALTIVMAPPAASVSAGWSGLFDYAAQQATYSFISSSAMAALSGADANTAFRRGYQAAALSGGLAVGDKIALGMRKPMVEQSERCGCVGKNSVGYRGDKVKIGGSRPDLRGVYSGSPAGGDQIGQGNLGFKSWTYGEGSPADYLVEAFAGPHDFLNNAVGLYTEAGYWAGNVTGGYSLFWEITNGVIAAPIVASSALAPISPAIVGVGVIDDYY